jgi:hypothetical protein
MLDDCSLTGGKTGVLNLLKHDTKVHVEKILLK